MLTANLPSMANLALLPGQEVLLIPALIVGNYCISNKTFKGAAILLFLSILVLPLHILLAKKFGFVYKHPSGYMFMSCSFWGYLLVSAARGSMVRVLLAIMLVLQGCAIVYFGYRGTLDVVMGAVSGIVLIFAYRLLNTDGSHSKLVNGLIFAIATALFYFFYNATSYAYLLMPYAALSAITLGNILFPTGDKNYKGLSILSIAVIVAVVGGCLYGYLQFPQYAPVFAAAFVLWMFTGLETKVCNSIAD